LYPEKVELTCRINRGEPAADIHWYREGKEIYKSDKYEMSADGDLVSLTIATSEPSDAATYQCEAVNKLGKVKTECSVVVNGKYFCSAIIVINSI
jgi:hypothetical protein